MSIKKQTVAQISLSPAWGGLEMACRDWAGQFHENGYDSILICRRGSPLFNLAGAVPFKVIGIDFSGGYLNLGASRLIRQALKSYNVNSLLIHSLKDLWVIYPALLGLNIKCVGFAHMFLSRVNKRDFLHSLLYGRLSHLVALTSVQKAELLKCLPVEESKYVVVPNSVDTNIFVPLLDEDSRGRLRAKFGVGRGLKVIGFLGRIDPQKGIGEFLVAARELLSGNPNLCFTVMGGASVGEDSLASSILRELESLKSERFIYFPPSADVVPYLQMLDVFVMPSYEETFGKVLIEAMSCGIPSIATNKGGVPDIIEHGVNGLLIESRSSAAIKDAVLSLITDEPLLAKLRTSSRQSAVDRYDRKLVFQQIASLIPSQ